MMPNAFRNRSDPAPRMFDQPQTPYWSAAPMPPGPAGRPLFWGGREGDLFRIHFGNLALTILTLGIYRFWGIVRIRRYVWSRTGFLGDWLEYTGTGGELLRGFLLAFALLAPLLILSQLIDILTMDDWRLKAAIWAVWFIAFVYLLAVARHAARRYIASRTRWRGLRFAVTGSPWRCGTVQLGWFFATVLTLGVARPWAMVAEARWSLGRLHLGTQPFQFTGQGGQLLRPYLVSALLMLMGIVLVALLLLSPIMSAVTEFRAFENQNPGKGAEQIAFTMMRLVMLAILAPVLLLPFLLTAWFNFAAAAMRWRWENLHLGGARFAMPGLGGFRLARLQLGNWVLSAVSFGLLYPIILRRNAAFLAERLWTDRFPDVLAARQVGAGDARSGEGLASALDGGGAGFGL